MRRRSSRKSRTAAAASTHVLDIWWYCRAGGGQGCVNKHHPVYQYVYLDALEMLPDYESMMAEELQPTGSRYDAQISVLGRSFQGKLVRKRFSR